MLLAYVDESARDESERYFMGAVMLDDAGSAALAEELDAHVKEGAWANGLSAYVELHAYDIWQLKAEWKGANDTPALEKMLLKSMESITRLSTHLVWRALDVARQTERGYPDVWPAERVTFQHLLEQVNLYGQRMSQRVLVVRDEVGDMDSPRRQFAQYRRTGTPGYRASDLPWILDTIHFAPSKHSRLLQAADLYAYTVCMHRYRDRLHPKAQPLWDRMYQLVWDSGKQYGEGTWP